MLEFIEMTPFSESVIATYDVWADNLRIGTVIKNGEGTGFLPNSKSDIICRNYLNEIVGFLNEWSKG